MKRFKNQLDFSESLMGLPIADWGMAVAERCGFQVTRAANSLKTKRLEVLAGLPIDVVLDIGANVGQWAQEVRAGGYCGRIISFEPCTSAFTQLEALTRKNSQHECMQLGLGDREGDAQLIVPEATETSSFRKEISDIQSPIAKGASYQETVPMRRLDSVIEDLVRGQDRIYIKVDTQGFEREVLSGARETLKRADAIEIELSLIELYQGQALLPEVWKMLTEAGFRPAWIERGYRDARDIWLLQIDGLFVRESSWSGRKRADLMVGCS